MAYNNFQFRAGKPKVEASAVSVGLKAMIWFTDATFWLPPQGRTREHYGVSYKGIKSKYPLKKPTS